MQHDLNVIVEEHANLLDQIIATPRDFVESPVNMFDAQRRRPATTDDLTEALRIGDNVYFKRLNSSEDQWRRGEIKQITKEHGRTLFQILGDGDHSWDITSMPYDPRRVRKMMQTQPYERTLNYDAIKVHIPRRPPRVEEKRVSRWTVFEVAAWIKHVGINSRPSSPSRSSVGDGNSVASTNGGNEFTAYIPLFVAENINGMRLLALTQTDMRKMGIANTLHRSEIQLQIQRLRDQMERIEDVLVDRDSPERPYRSYTMEDFEAKHQEIAERFAHHQSTMINPESSPVPQTGRLRRAGYMLEKLRKRQQTNRQASPGPSSGPNSRRGSHQRTVRTPPPQRNLVQPGDTVETKFGYGEVLDTVPTFWVVRLKDGRVLYELFRHELEKWTVVDVSTWCKTILGERFRPYAQRFLLERIDGTQLLGLTDDDLRNRVLIDDPESRSLLLDELKGLRSLRPIRIRPEWHEDPGSPPSRRWSRHSEQEDGRRSGHHSRHQSQTGHHSRHASRGGAPDSAKPFGRHRVLPSNVSEFSLIVDDFPDSDSASNSSEEKFQQPTTRAETFPRRELHQKTLTFRSARGVDDDDEPVEAILSTGLFTRTKKRFSQNVKRDRDADYTIRSPPVRRLPHSPPIDEHHSTPSSWRGTSEHSRTRSTNPSDRTSQGSGDMFEGNHYEDEVGAPQSMSKEAVIGSQTMSTSLYQSPSFVSPPDLHPETSSMMVYGAREEEQDDLMDLGSVPDNNLDNRRPIGGVTRSSNYPTDSYREPLSEYNRTDVGYGGHVRNSSFGQPTTMYMGYDTPPVPHTTYDDTIIYDYRSGSQSPQRRLSSHQRQRSSGGFQAPYIVDGDAQGSGRTSARTSARSSRRSSRRPSRGTREPSPDYYGVSSRRSSSGVGYRRDEQVDNQRLSPEKRTRERHGRSRSTSDGQRPYGGQYEHNSISNLRRAKSGVAGRMVSTIREHGHLRNSSGRSERATGQTIEAPRPVSRKGQDNDYFRSISDMFD